ncbi:MAG: hypothetical protein U1E36_01640 [Rickettsiales bacterium]
MKTDQTVDQVNALSGAEMPSAKVWADARQQEETHVRDVGNTSQPESPKEPKGYLAAHLGKWAFDHKDTMKNNWLPWYGVRNAGASVLGISALVTILVPVRYGFNALRTATEKSTGLLGRNLNIAANGLTENVVGTGLSFAGFRTGYKLWQRTYDKLFVKPKTEDEASQAVSNIPSTVAKDLGALAPVEFPATFLSAIPLVALRSGVRVSGNQFNKFRSQDPLYKGQQIFEWQAGGKRVITDASGLVAAGKDSRIKDIIGCIPAYTAFFEMNERIFDDFQTRRGHRKNEHSHVKGVLPPDEQSKEKKPFDTMLEDTPARMYFYKVASVAAGIIPYIAWSRYAQNTKGWQMSAANDNFWSAWMKENKMYQGFALYTVGSEVARNNIDKLFQKLQDKELEKQGIK